MSRFVEEFRSYDGADWDGYGAEPITSETVKNADLINEMLTAAGAGPWPAPGGDGSIGFEFTFQGQSFFLDVIGSKITGHVKSQPKQV
jgi:hypothetical protein